MTHLDDTHPAAALAATLRTAALTATPVPAPTGAALDDDLGAAAAVQAELVALAVAEGARPVGYKVALTTPALQGALGTDAPVSGVLLDAMRLAADASVARASLVRPIVEVEVAVRVGRPLGPSPSAREVRAALDAIAPAIEIADSRLQGRFTAADCVADNAFGARFVLGEWTPVGSIDLAAVEAALEVPDGSIVEGRGDAVAGGPLGSLAWLATALAAPAGPGLGPGDVVLTGSLTRPTPAELGRYSALITGVGTLAVTFV